MAGTVFGNRGPLSNEGSSVFGGDMLSSSWPVSNLYLIISGLNTWLQELDDTARIILLASAVSSLFLTSWYFYSVHRRRGAMARPLLLFLLLVYVLGLFALNLSRNPHDYPSLERSASDDDEGGQHVIPNIVDPEAVDPQSVCPGYKAYNVKTSIRTMEADLILAGKACNVYGNEIEALSLLVEHQSSDRLHVEIKPKYIGKNNYTWFELPREILQKPGMEVPHSDSDLEFSWKNDPTFSFTVTRKSNDDIVFTTQGSKLVYEDQFIEFKSSLPKNYNLYGLGEVIHGLRLGNNLTRTLFTADVGTVIDSNIYGHHPIYYDTRYFNADDKSDKLTYVPNATDKSARYISKTHGVFNRNAHTQEILLQESGITWRALGGSIDLYFFQGPSHDAVVKCYQKSIIGLPTLQQVWTFGFHQCKWGYKSWKEVREVVNSFSKFRIPLETIWTDIDYMNKYRNFENDRSLFGYEEGEKFISWIHDNKQHYIPIVDAAIYAPKPNDSSDKYPTFDRGVEQDAFMLNPNGSLYIGQVWPGYTVFPDWVGAVLNGTGAMKWWSSELSTWYKKIKFDGIWIDMNEVSSFCVGSCGTGKLNKAKAKARDATSGVTSASSDQAITPKSYLRTKPTPGHRNVNWPPYTVNNYWKDLAVHAVSPNATHHGGYQEYDFHNVFGHQMINATRRALTDIAPAKRPFIISRSQFAGSGKWAGHWGGDNWSEWAYLYFSIPHALSYSLFGFPMFGVDVCGFGGDTTDELCSRWMQLGAFFPFYRNHNSAGSRPQEPYLFSNTAEASRKAMKIRYALLPYIYTTFYLSHSTGSTTMRALSWDFPDEPWLGDADRQFLLGDAIMVTPCLEEGATTVKGVFPGVGSGTVWYDWYNQSAIAGVSAGENVTIDAPLNHIPVYIKGGNVIPMQEPAQTVADVRASPYSLIIALDTKHKARGGLYLDDGETFGTKDTKWVEFAATMTSLTVSSSGSFKASQPLGNITILGFKGSVSSLQLNGKNVRGCSWEIYKKNDTLKISHLESITRHGAFSTNWTLTWSNA